MGKRKAEPIKDRYVSNISKQGIKNYDFIRKGLEDGKSANQILKELQKQGKGYNRQRFLKDVKEIKQNIEKSKKIPSIPKNKTIDQDFYEPTAKKIKRKYLTVFEITLEDKNTGETRKIKVSTRHNKPHKRGYLEQKVKDKVQGSPTKSGVKPSEIIKEIIPIQGFRRVDL